MNFNKERIEIRVKGPESFQEIGIFLPWDANLDDWKSAFKTILINQTFTEDVVKDFFFDDDLHECKEDKDPDWERE